MDRIGIPGRALVAAALWVAAITPVPGAADLGPCRRESDPQSAFEDDAAAAGEIATDELLDVTFGSPFAAAAALLSEGATVSAASPVGDENLLLASWIDSVPGGDEAGATEPIDAGHPTWQAVPRTPQFGYRLLPAGFMYRSYLAGIKEPRMGWSLLWESERGKVFEAALGGRFGLVRYGTPDAIHPQGWQIDLEGAALPRVDPEASSFGLEAVDFRVGCLWTLRHGPTAVKAGYYHLSSHLGDEFLIQNPTVVRRNYVRNALIVGLMRDLAPNVQAYGEIACAARGDVGGSEPLEFQFGVQYLPNRDTGRRGAPFAAVNAQLREEVDFGGGLNMTAGWLWRGADTGHMFRVGMQFYNGKSIQYELLERNEQFVGLGIWFDS